MGSRGRKERSWSSLGTGVLRLESDMSVGDARLALPDAGAKKLSEAREASVKLLEETGERSEAV